MHQLVKVGLSGAVWISAFCVPVMGGEPTSCDLLAASPFDTGAIAAPVQLADIDTGAAIAACRKAVAAAPDEPRLVFQLARSLEAADEGAEAFRTYGLAADAGYPAAMNGLGRTYQYGIGTGVDVGAAITWFGKGALLGDPGAMTNLGQLYEDGDVVAKDAATAFVWYLRAAEAGGALAQTKVGFAYATGTPVPIDYGAAKSWFEKAAAKGQANALTNLGFMYETGKGVAPDFRKAARFYYDAVAAADPDALNDFAAYAFDMNAETLKDVEELLRADDPTLSGDADGIPDAETVTALARRADVDPTPLLAALTAATEAEGAAHTTKP